ncbi:MAG: sigma-70 family RNA polymerase sigma factor [Flavisolibacter sp.]|nr:sigma-70 family RNA polymerase sigma factor [Flavisolibacter sp.]
MNRQYQHISDIELLERYYSEKNQEWIGILLERYTMLLFGVCMKYLKDENEARDCVQQVFLKVLMEIPKYRVEYFKSWLYIIAKNHCLMRLRSRGSKSPKELNESLLVFSEETPRKEIEEKELTFDLLEHALDELNEEQKQCVILFYLKKRSYQQIAEITGFTLLQVKSYIQNGKRNLKIILETKLKEKRENER